MNQKISTKQKPEGYFKVPTSPKLVLWQTVNSKSKNAASGTDPIWGAAPGPHRYLGFEVHPNFFLFFQTTRQN